MIEKDWQPVEYELREEREAMAAEFQARVEDESLPLRTSIAIDTPGANRIEDSLSVLHMGEHETVMAVNVIDASIVPPKGILAATAMDRSRYEGKLNFSQNLGRDMLSLKEGEVRPILSFLMHIDHNTEGPEAVTFVGVERARTVIQGNDIDFNAVADAASVHEAVAEDQSEEAKRLIEIAQALGTPIGGDEMTFHNVVGFYNSLAAGFARQMLKNAKVPFAHVKARTAEKGSAPVTSPARKINSFVNLHNLVALMDGEDPPFTILDRDLFLDSSADFALGHTFTNSPRRSVSELIGKYGHRRQDAEYIVATRELIVSSGEDGQH